MNGWQVTVIVWTVLDVVLGFVLHGLPYKVNAWADTIAKALFV